ncbi:hypothetical protein Hypma_010388 [Hypsizygus marmoreus]|uniref:Uncharacterized protein n=1 Tax=Hypsizygus marmoreus TaxID=39966 RepID=A0A369JT73_HYPMA|nr:hypothetical protein Hypma_010388 [Hypsizygus marmoreus]
MTSLPSFVELMASLGLDQVTKNPDQMPKSSVSSPSSSPRPTGAIVPLHTRNSMQSLRDTNLTRPRVARYAPYSPVVSATRRGSISSISSSSLERDRSPLRSYSASPRPPSSPRFSRRPMNKLSVNVYGSVSDLAANTPISSYVRRKTPGTSPTSPTFSLESRCDSPPVSPVPLTVPTLPTLYPHSATSDSFPITPSDSEMLSFENDPSLYTFGDAPKAKSLSRRPRRSVGVRISTPPRSAELHGHYQRRRSFAHIA